MHTLLSLKYTHKLCTFMYIYIYIYGSFGNFIHFPSFGKMYSDPHPKALAGTSGGQHKETIVVTYKSLIRYLFLYPPPIWLPNTFQSNINKVQTLQNSTCRIATGCVKMTPIPDLDSETQTLPLRDHFSYPLPNPCPSTSTFRSLTLGHLWTWT